MIRQKPKATLEQLVNPHRPLLFSEMPRMLRGDGMMAGALQHEFRYLRNIPIHPGPVSAHRWNLALRTSRILRGHRRRTSLAQ